MLTNKNAISLKASTTVDLNNSMSTAEIQALINSMPRNLGGYTITFQFADGTYSLTAALSFSYFYNGSINVYGNAADNTKSATKLVKLYSSSNGVITLSRIEATLTVRYMDFRNDDVVNAATVNITQCTKATLQFCYIHVVGLTAGNVNGLIMYENPSVRDYLNLFGLSNLGVYASQNTHYILQSSTDNGGGDQPVTGLQASYNSVIGKSDGGAVSGSSTNETATTGGVIR